MPKLDGCLAAPCRPFGGPHLGEPSGGNWMVARRRRSDSVRGPARRPGCVGWAPFLCELTPARALTPALDGSYLVDSASSHMLVSKIKPCKSKYKQLYGETANGSLNQLSFI